MSPETRHILKTTWAMVVPIGDAAATLFYDRLFTLDPSLKRLFANTDMKEQRRKLMQAIAAVINGIDHLDALVPALQNLGRNHMSSTAGRNRPALDAGARPQGWLDAGGEMSMDGGLRHRGNGDARRGRGERG